MDLIERYTYAVGQKIWNKNRKDKTDASTIRITESGYLKV
ncbi:MAG: hypothetical protein XD91_0452 [Clostridiales bacterium 38_11]|nr:MAG: hypothetical protein XD91_0452 [Clostridiales bacterium 38_11]